EFWDEDVGDCDVGEPFLIGGYHVPRRPFSARVAEYVFERLVIIVPARPFLHIVRGKLPILFRCIQAGQETPALLFARDVEKEFQYLNAVVDQITLEVVNLTEASLPNVLRQGLRR